MVGRRARVGRILASVAAGVALVVLAVVFAPSVLAPWVARALSARAGVPVRIGWIAWNPVRGSVGFHDVRVATAAETPPIITIASVRIDVALRPLLARELVITRLVLRRPWVALRRTPSGDFNVASLFPSAGASPMPPPLAAPARDAAERALRIGELRIEGGSVEFRDETTSPVLETALHLKDVTADDLVIALAGRTDVRCHLESRLERRPLTLDLTYRATGADTSLNAKLTTAGASLARTLLYLPLGWRQVTGTLDATLDYARETADGSLRRHTIAATASIRDLALGEPWASAPTFRAHGARLQSIAVDFVRRRTELGPIVVEDFRALIARDEHGVHVPLVASGRARGGQGWATTLAQVTLGSGVVVLRNVVPGSEGELSVPVSSGAVQVEPEAVTFDVDANPWGGRIEAHGQADDRTTEIRFGLTGLSLPQVAARLGSPVGFTESRLEGSLVGRFGSDGPRFSGTIHLPGGRSLPPDPARPAEIFAWQDVTIELTELALAPLRVRLGSVTAAWPYLMIARSSHGLFPLRLADRAAGDGTIRSDDARPVLAIDAFGAHGARVEFYDTTLPSPYWTELANADLALERITAPPIAIARLRVNGELDEISPVEAHGTIGPDTSDLSIRAAQVRLAPLSAYLGPVLGYQVTSGVARVESRVRVQGAELHASNDVVLSRLALAGSGEDALQRELGAPLSVALALMKDYRGDIRLSLPITGDLAAQEYRVENVVPTALREALVGALRAPVTLLGSVFHRDEGERFDLRPIPFPPGSAELGPPGEERIGQIAGLLTRQPGLVAVLIPEPSVADVAALRASAAAKPSVDEQVKTLADARANIVSRRLVEGHHVAPHRVDATPWQPGEPVPDASPGVDVQLRGGAG
jgi:hypothetical protein